MGRSVTIEGLEIAVFRSNGELYALENLCPHLGFPLTEGIVKDDVVICGWHGWRVRLGDGGCPGKTSTARTFACKLHEGDVYLEIPALAT
jgi:nitrite reductase (NADH) small subunit